MEVLLVIIYISLATILIGCLLLTTNSSISYQVERDDNKNSKKVTFEDFKSRFEKIEWLQDYDFLDYLTNEETKSKIFCNDYIINGIRYFFTNYFEWKKWKKYFTNIIKLSDIKINQDISIDDKMKIMDNKFNSHVEAKKKIEDRLCSSLKNLCEQLNIDVSYHDALGDAAGRILYRSDCGRYILDGSRIEILNEHKNKPWVLAHELGHYMAIKQRSDTTEEGADKEALRLCNSILTEQEHEEIKDYLKVYFENTMKS